MGTQIDRNSLIDAVHKFLHDTRMSATRFGYTAVGDPGFVRKLRTGHDFRISTLERAQAYLTSSK